MLAPHQGNEGAVDHTLFLLQQAATWKGKKIPFCTFAIYADQHPSVRIQLQKCKKQNKKRTSHLPPSSTHRKQTKKAASNHITYPEE